MRGDVERLLDKIAAYQPFNEQEEKDKLLILGALQSMPDIFERSNVVMHMTASGWVVNREHRKLLMVYHNLYKSWSWLGGHADGETDLLSVALREVKEESGVRNVRPLSKEIYSLEILSVPGHEKRGTYVSSHLHLNVTYLLEADEGDVLRVKADENSGVRWVPLEEVMAASSETWLKERVYEKLFRKLSLMECAECFT